MAGPLHGGASQLFVLASVKQTPPARAGRLYGMASMGPRQTLYAKAGETYALVSYAANPFNTAKDSRIYALVSYALGLGSESRSRAWSFDLDGHTFYVLDLGDTGTFLYDMTTQQWCQFDTAGYTGWNLRNGVTFGPSSRVVGGDTLNGIVWELVPDEPLDEGFRTIEHIVTGGIAMRSRVYISVESVRLSGSIGGLESETPTTVTLAFSDDGGNTWSTDFPVTLTPGNFSGEVAWRSLGAFMAPGRVFRVTDSGGMLRIDGADIFIEDFDDLNSKVARMYGIYTNG